MSAMDERRTLLVDGLKVTETPHWYDRPLRLANMIRRLWQPSICGERLDRLAGTWELVRAEMTDDAGRLHTPWGDKPAGRATYTGDGHMCVMIQAAERRRFPTEDRGSASLEEKAAAFDGFVAYAGRWDITEDLLRHHVEVSSFPNWVGGELVRRADIAGDHMTLTTCGGAPTWRTEWVRCAVVGDGDAPPPQQR